MGIGTYYASQDVMLAEHKPHRSATAQAVVLLGASNLSRAFPTVVNLLGDGLDGPLNLCVAMGHGRSYGRWSEIMGRSLPGIMQCGLWPELDTQEFRELSPLAMVCDLGNDLVYGVKADRLLEWLERILSRLSQIKSDTIMVSLPLAGLEQLSPIRFNLIRHLFFPGHGADWSALKDEIFRLDAGMRELCRHYAAHWVECPEHWYGWDPIHIRSSCQSSAWQSIFSHWPAWRCEPERPGPGLLESLTLRQLRPAERRILGYLQHTEQPVLHRPGMHVSLF